MSKNTPQADQVREAVQALRHNRALLATRANVSIDVVDGELDHLEKWDPAHEPFAGVIRARFGRVRSWLTSVPEFDAIAEGLDTILTKAESNR